MPKKIMTQKNFKAVAELICATLERRKKNRKDLEDKWKEIDRQLAMTPHNPMRDRTGQVPPQDAWRPWYELPWQSQALEILTADVRRFLFPTERNYFSANGDMDDDLLRAIKEGAPTVDSDVNGEDVSAIIEGCHLHFQSLYDFRGNWDLVNAEAFKYGIGIGRVIKVNHEKYFNKPQGIFVNQTKLPIFQPISIKNTYLDDAPQTYNGFALTPSTIEEKSHKLDDLKKITGEGWRKDALQRMEADESGLVHLIEFEGDIVLSRSQDTLHWPNIRVTVAKGKEIDVIRWEDVKHSSYIASPYHKESIGPYGTSPLLKGLPIQQAASHTLSRLMQSSILNVNPPVKFDPNDPHFAANSGPVISPNALWQTLGTAEAVEIGDMTGQSAVFVGLQRQYEEMTGVSSVRLGAQTKSHQTAFAVDQEAQRGQVRTIDYARSVMHSPMPDYLQTEYAMIRESLKKPTDVYIPKFRTYLTVSSDMLPEKVNYDVHGQAGPLEEQEKTNRKLSAMQNLMSLYPTLVQLKAQGMDVDVPNINEMQRLILEEGGFDDVDRFLVTTNENQTQAVAGGPGLPGTPALTAPPSLAQV